VVQYSLPRLEANPSSVDVRKVLSDDAHTILFDDLLKKRQTFTLSDDLLKEIAEFRWRNRIPSLSKAVEHVLRKWVAASAQSTQLVAEDPAETERKINNDAYREMKTTLERKGESSFAVVAIGKLQGYAPTLEEAFALLNSRAPEAKQAIIQKIGEKVETEAVWEAVGERIS